MSHHCNANIIFRNMLNIKEKFFWMALFLSLSSTIATCTKGEVNENEEGGICVKDNPCVNDAICGNTPKGYICKCPAGWEGGNCDIDVNECLKFPCGQGTCHNEDGYYWCECPSGLTGTYCEENVDACANDVCKNEAQCRNTYGSYICMCKKGWKGYTCDQDINECDNNPCQNGGQCTNSEGSFSCSCTDGWEGPVCDQDVDECLTSACENGALCNNTCGSFICSCKPGWEGDVCNQDINECDTNPCENGGQCTNSEGSFTCSCAGGWRGPACNQVLQYFGFINGCSGEWRAIVKTGADGTEINGSKRDRVDRLVAGDEIRISLNNSIFQTSIQSATLTENENVCVQTIFLLGRSAYDEFSGDLYWNFLIVCTTGHAHVSRWYVGEHNSKGNATLVVDIVWFVRSCAAEKPVYCNTLSGARTCGDKSVLLNAVNNGASVKVLKPETGFMTRLTTIEVSNSLDVHGQYPWRLGQVKMGDEYEFPTRVFWLLTTWSTTGTIPTSQWYVGQHISLNTFQDFGSMEWLVDDCWTQVYSHDTFGRGIHGSLDLLVESVLAGKRVRVKINSYITEADNLYVRNGQVSAQLLGQFSKTSAYNFPTNVNWIWQIASTTGDVETVRYDIGSIINRLSSNDKESITWFVESRPWSKVLTTSSSGIATYGSKSNLITSLQRGSPLRLVIYEGDNSYRIIEADNIAIQNSEVAVQSIRYIGDENGSGRIPRRFKSPAYWRFTLTSTNGNQRVAWWKVGEHSSLPATIENYQVDWIVG